MPSIVFLCLGVLNAGHHHLGYLPGRRIAVVPVISVTNLALHDVPKLFTRYGEFVDVSRAEERSPSTVIALLLPNPPTPLTPSMK